MSEWWIIPAARDALRLSYDDGGKAKITHGRRREERDAVAPTVCKSKERTASFCSKVITAWLPLVVNMRALPANYVVL